MILLYVDTSALFKRYVAEDESEAVLARLEESPTVGTVLITRVEVANWTTTATTRSPLARKKPKKSVNLETQISRFALWKHHHAIRTAQIRSAAPSGWCVLWGCILLLRVPRAPNRTMAFGVRSGCILCVGHSVADVVCAFSGEVEMASASTTR